MAFVLWREGISYGFSMIGFLLVVVWLGAIPIIVGSAMISEDSQRFIGWLVAGIGYTVLLAGSYGAMYKIIADGVARGNGHIEGLQTTKQRIQARLNEP